MDVNHSSNDTRIPQKETPLDWRSIDTSTPEGLRALDWVIAQRLGWERDGFQFTHNAKAFVHGGLPVPHFLDYPHYTADLNLAWALIDGDGATLSGKYTTPNRNFLYGAACDEFPYGTEANAATPALACCYAYLERDDARRAAEGGAES